MERVERFVGGFANGIRIPACLATKRGVCRAHARGSSRPPESWSSSAASSAELARRPGRQQRDARAQSQSRPLRERRQHEQRVRQVKGPGRPAFACRYDLEPRLFSRLQQQRLPLELLPQRPQRASQSRAPRQTSVRPSNVRAWYFGVPIHSPPVILSEAKDLATQSHVCSSARRTGEARSFRSLRSLTSANLIRAGRTLPRDRSDQRTRRHLTLRARTRCA